MGRNTMFCVIFTVQIVSARHEAKARFASDVTLFPDSFFACISQCISFVITVGKESQFSCMKAFFFICD